MKFAILVVITGLTLAIHYGWLTEWLLGHIHWIHALHSRFCYIPIVVAASWFGLRGGIYSATAISLLILPYIFKANPDVHNLSMELVEVFFYYGIGVLVGALVDRESRARLKNESTLLKLERSERLSLVGQMAAGVAHEIKNPLTSIKGALEIVGDESVAKSAREDFRKIGLKEVKRIDATIGEFLEFARPKVAKKQLMDLSASVEESLMQVLPQVTRANLKLFQSIEKGIKILGDQEQLHQVALNLLLNAIEACRDGDMITVNLDRRASNEVLFTISDSGKGMTESELAQAFDPFFTTKTTGTGLGLSIVKLIIENHEGEIELASRPLEGTLVSVALPGLRA